MSNVLSTAQITKIKTLLSKIDDKADEIVAKFGAVSAVSPMSDFWAISDLTREGEELVSKTRAEFPVVSGDSTGNGKVNNVLSSAEVSRFAELVGGLKDSFVSVRFEIEKCETTQIIILGQRILQDVRSIQSQTARTRGFLPGGLTPKEEGVATETVHRGETAEWKVSDLFSAHSKASIEALSSDDSMLTVLSADSKTVKAQFTHNAQGSVSITISAKDGNTLVEHRKEYQVQ